MPRTPRNPGSGKAPVNTPARNEPATGDGWGGPPNGEGNRQAGPGRPEGVANGEGKRARAQAALDDAAELAVKTVIDIATDTTDQRALAAAMHILNRTLGETTKPTTISGPGGGPLEIVRRIIVPTPD